MITDESKTPTEIYIQEGMEKMIYGVNQDGRIPGMVKYVRYDHVPKPEEMFAVPSTPIKDAIEVTSRMAHIDDELKPIAEFILEYAGWNLHTYEWNQPTIEVPLFRVLDALAQRGKPYCCAG